MKQTVTLSKEEVEEAIREWVRTHDPGPINCKTPWTIRVVVTCREVGPQREPWTEHEVTAKAERDL